MKPYFVKLLPVDEKIKMGDKALDKSDNRIITVTSIYDDTDMDGNDITMIGDDESTSSVCVKLKFFLCKNDIQEIEDEVGYSINEILFSKRNLANIIGPISPDAIWIKEGDEFDEDDVEEWWYWLPWGGFYRKKKDNMDMSWIRGQGLECTSYFKLKGHCGHFH